MHYRNGTRQQAAGGAWGARTVWVLSCSIRAADQAAGLAQAQLLQLFGVEPGGHFQVRTHAALECIGANVGEQGVERVALRPARLRCQVRRQLQQGDFLRMQAGGVEVGDGVAAHALKLWQQSGFTVLMVTHDVEEALFLADRVVVFFPRPAQVVAEVDVKLPYPRHRGQSEFVQLRQKLLSHLGLPDSL